MIASMQQARNEIYAVVKSAWDPTNLIMLYPDLDADQPSQAVTSSWARCAIFHLNSRVVSLGRPSIRRRTGYLSVEIFSPAGDGLQSATNLAMLLITAFEGHSTPGGVWFREIRPREQGRDGGYQLFEVQIDFEYDEVR